MSETILYILFYLFYIVCFAIAIKVFCWVCINHVDSNNVSFYDASAHLEEENERYYPD
jgi:hypothetical protein